MQDFVLFLLIQELYLIRRLGDLFVCESLRSFDWCLINYIFFYFFFDRVYKVSFF